MTLVVVAVIVLLILVNALYVAAEFSAVSVRRSRLQQRAEDGDRLAKRLLPIILDGARLDRYIAACQIGITISSLALGAYGQATLAASLSPFFESLGGLQVAAAQSLSAGIVLVLLTVLQMVFGELVPKSIALQYPTKMARWTVIPMQWSTRALRWLIAILNGSGVFLLRLVGMPASGHRHIHSAAEIEYLIAESREGGQLEPAESARLRQALRLSLRTAGELMVPRTRIVGVPLSASGTEALELLRSTPYSRLPVYDKTLDHVLGVLHVRDVAARLIGSAGAQAISPRDMMRPVLVVPESMTVDRVLERLRTERRAMAIVGDEFGGTAGLITVGDLLDELLGETADEFKLGDAAPTRLPDGRVRVPGDLRLDIAAAWVGVLWESDSYTVAGFLMEHLGRLPAVGDTLDVDGVRIEVEAMRGRSVESLLVTPAARKPAGD
jgi:CBS domain containing-hemolysin-like protein